MTVVLRIGLLGLGRIGRIHLNTINSLPNACCTAVAVQSINKSRAFLDKSVIKPKLTNDVTQVINDPDVDALVICSPTDLHNEHVVQCAHAKKPFFCEKPLSVDFRTGETVRGVIEKNGTFCMMGFHRRFDTNWERVKEAIIKGEIGQLHTVNIIARDRDPPSLEYAMKSGGLYADMTVHDFDIAQYLVDASINEVYAIGRCFINEELGKLGDIDTSIVTLSFTNGVVGTICNSRKATYGQDQRAELFGSGGMIQLENKFYNDCIMSTTENIHRDLPMIGWNDRYIEAYKNEIRAFVDCVLHGKPSPCTVTDAQKAASVAAAARKSLYSNKPVQVEAV